MNIESTANDITVDILDTGIGEPTVRVASRGEASGRGLKIVDALADQWGVRSNPTSPGKTVWFKLSTTTVSTPVN